MNNFSITIGRYIPGNSYFYRIDPRIKILGTIILMVGAFLIPSTSVYSLYVLLGFFALLLLIIITSKINFLAFLKGLQPILLISTITFVLQLIYNKEGSVIKAFDIHFSVLTIGILVALVLIFLFTSKYFKLKFIYFILLVICGFIALIYIDLNTFSKPVFNVTDTGILRASFYALRIVIAVTISTMLTISTSTNDINLGLEWLLKPLSYIKIPISTLAMMLSLTLRFIPTLTIETDKIMKAQASRGIDFNEGNILQKIKQITTLLIPIFATSIMMAEDLANAMEVRGYIVGAKRTSIDELRFKFIDLVAGLSILALLALAIVAVILL